MDCDCPECRQWLDQESPGPWSTLMVVVAVLALVVFLVGR